MTALRNLSPPTKTSPQGLVPGQPTRTVTGSQISDDSNIRYVARRNPGASEIGEIGGGIKWLGTALFFFLSDKHHFGTYLNFLK